MAGSRLEKRTHHVEEGNQRADNSIEETHVQGRETCWARGEVCFVRTPELPLFPCARIFCCRLKRPARAGHALDRGARAPSLWRIQHTWTDNVWEPEGIKIIIVLSLSLCLIMNLVCVCVCVCVQVFFFPPPAWTSETRFRLLRCAWLSVISFTIRNNFGGNA